MITFALDRSTSRTYDEDGRLRVSLTPISKATVNPYYGREIPGADRLGLEPNRIYNLLRDAGELAKAAPSFNGVQLLDAHIPVTAANPQDDAIVGAIGTDTTFDAPYLKASLIVWDADAIARIESGEQRELSCGYRYDADMTPGTYEGQPYDGVMRNIRGNHVALVEKGRAGPDVLVGDQALTQDELSTGERKALEDSDFAVPSKRKLPIENEKHIRLAWDLLDDTDGLTSEEKAEARKRILAAAKKHGIDVSDWKGAKDAAPVNHQPKEQHMAATKKARLDARLEALKPYLAQDADLDALRALIAQDESEEEREDDEKKGGEKANKKLDRERKDDDEPKGEDEDDEDDDKDDKAAMDAAIAAAVSKAKAEVRAEMNALAEAQRVVRPVVGDVFGMDSASAVYKHALTEMGVDLKGVPDAAFPAMFKLAADKRSAPKPMGMDAASVKSFFERFPNVSRIKNI